MYVSLGQFGIKVPKITIPPPTPSVPKPKPAPVIVGTGGMTAEEVKQREAQKAARIEGVKNAAVTAYAQAIASYATVEAAIQAGVDAAIAFARSLVTTGETTSSQVESSLGEITALAKQAISEAQAAGTVPTEAKSRMPLILGGLAVGAVVLYIIFKK